MAGWAALAIGLVGGLSRFWLCDDAFICFRYAKNLVNGNGLVFNVGERVEGFTNLLFTLGIAAAMKLGVRPEVFAPAAGLVSYLATLLLLLGEDRSADRAGGAAWPVGALVLAAHPDAHTFATGGLETATFTFLAFLGYVLLTRGDPARTRAAAGAVLALASLTRPDGILFVVVGLAYLTVWGRSRLLAFAGGFLVLWIPATLLRVSYYGDFFPNTYYAKSGGLAWWSQGLTYVALFFERSWPLLLAFPLTALVWLGRTEAPSDVKRRALLALAMAGVYMSYIARVGGDFMYARMLVPILPFLATLFSIGVHTVLRPPLARVAVLVVAVAGVAFTPCPVSATRFESGITDEWDFYHRARPAWEVEERRRALSLKRFFEGLPVGVAFFGGEAQLVYYAEPFLAVECTTGLTDRTIARQPLTERRRVGHEKIAAPAYVLSERRVHVAFDGDVARYLQLSLQITDARIDFDGVQGRLLRWDPEVLAAWAARGATFTDVPSRLDAYIREMDRFPDERVVFEYEKFRRFYFDHVDDPIRRQAFERRVKGLRPQ